MPKKSYIQRLNYIMHLWEHTKNFFIWFSLRSTHSKSFFQWVSFSLSKFNHLLRTRKTIENQVTKKIIRRTFTQKKQIKWKLCGDQNIEEDIKITTSTTNRSTGRHVFDYFDNISIRQKYVWVDGKKSN